MEAGSSKRYETRKNRTREVERAVQPAAQQAAAAFVQAQRVDGLLVVAGAVQQLAAAQQVPHLKLRAARHRTNTA